MKKIAIFGATGYIGKSLVYRFSQEVDFEFFLFVRSKEKIRSFLKSINSESRFGVYSIEDFDQFGFDVVINCAGIGNPSIFNESGSEIFRTTEFFDDLIMKGLEKKPDTIYINLSSGAVYGKNMAALIDGETEAVLNINNLKQKEYYSIAKINSEAKHRSRPDLNIVDVRVFSFFSRFVDTEVNFLMSEIASCIRNKKIFVTTKEDIVRDYIGVEDLFSFFIQIIKKEKINDCFDIYSLKTVTKIELLKSLHERYALEYKFKEEVEERSPTGTKNSYFSSSKKAETIGYSPKFTSIQLIQEELGKM